MIDSSYLLNLMAMNHLGLCVLEDTLKTAAKMFLPRHSTSKEIVETFYFIRGTGFELMLNRFGLNYDADELRSQFYYCVGYREKS